MCYGFANRKSIANRVRRFGPVECLHTMRAPVSDEVTTFRQAVADEGMATVFWKKIKVQKRQVFFYRSSYRLENFKKKKKMYVPRACAPNGEDAENRFTTRPIIALI